MSTAPSQSSKSKQPVKGNAEETGLDLTLGCEFEFLLVSFGKCKKIDGRSLSGEVLSEGLWATCDVCGELHQFELNLWEEPTRNRSYLYWEIDQDLTVKPTEEENACLGADCDKIFVFHRLELRSRILHSQRRLPTTRAATHIHEITYTEEIKAVLEHLNQSFGPFDVKKLSRAPYYMFVNKNCGLHVHVGNGDGSFSLDTVKRIFSTFIACERQIDGLHLKHRITGADLSTKDVEPPELLDMERLYSPKTKPEKLTQKEAWNRPPSTFFMFAAHNRRQSMDVPRHQYVSDVRLRYDVDSWLALVHKAYDLEDLTALYGNMGKCCTINLEQLVDPDDDDEEDNPGPLPLKRTIEFRQHAGTLQWPAVLSFINFLTSLVSSCHGMSGQDLFSFLGPGGRCREASFDTLSLLRDLGCDAGTITRYNNQLQGNSTRNTALFLEERHAQQALNRKDKIGLLATLVLENIRAERLHSDPDVVRITIGHKLLSGGYGQFSDEELRGILPADVDPENRDKLRVGRGSPGISKESHQSHVAWSWYIAFAMIAGKVLSLHNTINGSLADGKCDGPQAGFGNVGNQ